MTDLEAINTLLQHVGQRPATDSTGSQNATIAMSFIERESRRIQMREFPENTEDRVVLVRNGSNEFSDAEIRVGLQEDVKVLSVTVMGQRDRNLKIARRGTNLWWRDDSVSTGSPWEKTFDDDLEVKRLLQLPLGSLAEEVADYIVMSAASIAWPNEYIRFIDDARQKLAIERTLISEVRRTKSLAEALGREKTAENLLDTPEAKRIRGRRRGNSVMLG